LSAAIAYMQAGGERRYVARLVKYFGETFIKDINQDMIDAGAKAVYPGAIPATVARQFYVPVSAILHHALGDKCPEIKRPKGSKGKERKEWLWPEDAFAIVDEAGKIDDEFGLYLLTLLYTGIRKSEGLRILEEDVRLDELAAWLRDSKNGDPRMLKLREDLAVRIAAHLEANPDRERLFRFKDGGYLKHLLMRAKLAVAGLPCPKRRPKGWRQPPHRLAFVGFHTFRHTWATWMRRYAGADLQGLAGTNNWRNLRSVQRYSHVVAREEWDRVDKLPSVGNIRGKAAS
jgi:integrase